MRIEFEAEKIDSVGHILATNAASAFAAMSVAAKKDGLQLKVNSAFRTMGEQKKLYKKYQEGGNLAAKPGYSNHQSGVAVDINRAAANAGDSPIDVWLRNNAHKYGFYNTVANEPWHWEWRM